jgi:hypothetical protein
MESVYISDVFTFFMGVKRLDRYLGEELAQMPWQGGSPLKTISI